MGKQKKYWNSVQHLNNDPAFVASAEKEFAEYIPVDEFLSSETIQDASSSRRDFLKFLGFSVSAATLAACETPVVKSIPYVNKPHEINPGIANYYASTYYDGNDYASILVKNRDGRPIFIQGNDQSEYGAGVNARVNSSVLSLYNSNRLQKPLKAGKVSDWKTINDEVSQKLKNTVASGKKIMLLTRSIISPSTKALIEDLKSKYLNIANTVPGGELVHVPYDAISCSGLLRANQKSLGKRVVPNYRFDKAKTIVSFGADFLCGWLMSGQYAVQYGNVRKPELGAAMAKHYQFESRMSLTGSNADVRIPIKPSQTGKALVLLYNEIAKKASAPAMKSAQLKGFDAKIKQMANDLWSNKSKSLVVSGSNNESDQLIVNKINHLLGSYGTTIDLSTYSEIKQSDDVQIKNAIASMQSGSVGAVIVYGVDPVFNMPKASKFAEGFSKVPLKITLSERLDFTAKVSDYVCPTNHYLESWDDAEPQKGKLSIAQPVINPLYDSKSFQDILITWANLPLDYYSYIKKRWSNLGDTAFWKKSVHDGVASYSSNSGLSLQISDADLAGAGEKIFTQKSNGIELELYTKTAIADGMNADNPWLQELPDPISKVVWDNYITMNPEDMKKEGYGFQTNIQQEIPASMAKLSVGSDHITLPVFPSPGQTIGTVGIALGYGKAIVKEQVIGKNAAHFLTSNSDGDIQYYRTGVKIEPTGETYLMASSQTHNTIMDVDPKDPEVGRKIVNETTLEDFAKGKAHYNPDITLADAYGDQKTTKELDLWAEHPYDTFGHRWGMAIDLNTCFGCSACVTACHSENNVPVVGKDEVRRNRDMFWLRIDRYYSSDMNQDVAEEQGKGAVAMYAEMEHPSAYPQVVHQPLMCHHCNHAPCETVCPVAATTHSNEGLNQMTYNRCVGTRYCANNCPYKVRRFNWFQYDKYNKFTGVNPAQDDLARMVLNPDVTVRSRGVMEKCSMCVQRIQEGKLEAKKNAEPVKDGSIKTACQLACPTNAISFGDLNDKNSNVRAKFSDDRAYALLEEVGTQPNVKYLTKVRNLKESEA